MVGNGVTNWKYDGVPARVEQAYYFGIIDDAMYNKMQACDWAYFDVDPSSFSTDCVNMMNDFEALFKNI